VLITESEEEGVLLLLLSSLEKGEGGSQSPMALGFALRYEWGGRKRYTRSVVDSSVRRGGEGPVLPEQWLPGRPERRKDEHIPFETKGKKGGEEIILPGGGLSTFLSDT